MTRRKSSSKKPEIKKIAVCTSASFYTDCLTIEKDLKERGFIVALPSTIYTMKKTGNFNAFFYKTWLKDPAAFTQKASLMRKHFKATIAADAILVVNLEKKGQKGYIGGNVLMEMGIAFHYKKPIFVFNNIPKSCPHYEEILGMSPVFIKRDLSRIQI